MAAVGQNTFSISDASQLTEEGFSRIPRGMHHWSLSHGFTTPSTNTATQRTYTTLATIDLSHVGPQVIEKFKIGWDSAFLNDLVGGVNNLADAPRLQTLNIFSQMMFTTSLPTELSALDKSVSPASFDYTSAQYRLDKYTAGQTMIVGGQTEADANGIGAAQFAAGDVSATSIPWTNRWIELETKPLVVSTTLVLFFTIDATLNGTSFMNFDTAVANLDKQAIEIDILTRDHPMSNEDIWFARKLFNQGPENRLIYYRFANNPS